MESQKISCSSEQLLPGIPDEITFGEITSRLPWSVVRKLSAVSHDWRQAIQSRKVYDARVTSNSTETLVVVRHLLSDISAIALYSLRDKAFCEIPPLPPLNRGIPWSSHFISLDGKLYVFGGSFDQRKVQVLDLAGERHWKECASMLEPRDDFACGVLDGKIYVFGGVYQRDPVRGSEVYNPKENAWSGITPMLFSRQNHKVTTVGNEMFIHGGVCYSADDFDRRHPQLLAPESSFWEIYNPVKDNWRPVEPASGCSYTDTLFTENGVLYLMNSGGIHVQDGETNGWTHLHSISCDAVGLGVFEPFFILNVSDELLVLVETLDSAHAGHVGPCILQGRGFSSEDGQIVWEKVQCSFDFSFFGPYMCRIEL